MTYSYEIQELRPLISWPYFLWAWGMNGKPEAETRSLLQDAEAMLDSWEGKYKTHAILEVLEANSDGDDIIVYKDNKEIRLPMLRQQKTEGVCVCMSLADFIRPVRMGIRDKIGMFCTTMDDSAEAIYKDDPYSSMLYQTLADRLAEATAEKISEIMPGIRPAAGYPSMPDMSTNFLINDILDMQSIGIKLTESGMMIPHASVSGLIFSHPQATYFNISRIGDDQLADYARRRGFTIDEMRRFIKI